MSSDWTRFTRSHAPRGNAVWDALRPLRRARKAQPREAANPDDAERRRRHSHGGPWERVKWTVSGHNFPDSQ